MELKIKVQDQPSDGGGPISRPFLVTIVVMVGAMVTILLKAKKESQKKFNFHLKRCIK